MNNVKNALKGELQGELFFFDELEDIRGFLEGYFSPSEKLSYDVREYRGRFEKFLSQLKGLIKEKYSYVLQKGDVNCRLLPSFSEAQEYLVPEDASFVYMQSKEELSSLENSLGDEQGVLFFRTIFPHVFSSDLIFPLSMGDEKILQRMNESFSSAL